MRMETLWVLPFRAPAKNDRDVIVDAIVFRMSAQVPFEPQAGWATSARGAGGELWTGEQEWCWAEGVVARITAVPELQGQQGCGTCKVTPACFPALLDPQPIHLRIRGARGLVGRSFESLELRSPSSCQAFNTPRCRLIRCQANL